MFFLVLLQTPIVPLNSPKEVYSFGLPLPIPQKRLSMRDSTKLSGSYIKKKSVMTLVAIISLIILSEIGDIVIV